MTICGDVVGWIFRVSVYAGLTLFLGVCTLEFIVLSLPLSRQVMSDDDEAIRSYCVAIFGRCDVSSSGLYVVAVLLTLVMSALSIMLAALTGIMADQTCSHVTALCKSKGE